MEGRVRFSPAWDFAGEASYVSVDDILMNVHRTLPDKHVCPRKYHNIYAKNVEDEKVLET